MATTHKPWPDGRRGRAGRRERGADERALGVLWWLPLPSLVASLGTSVAAISQPTETLIAMIDAIGLELDIRIRRQPAKRNDTYSPLKVHSTI